MAVKKHKIRLVLGIMAAVMLTGLVLNHFNIINLNEYRLDFAPVAEAKIGGECITDAECNAKTETCDTKTKKCRAKGPAGPAATETETTAEQAIAQASKELQAWISVMLQFLSALLWPILLLIGGLLKNDILFGGEMGERLNWIWVQVRNLVNIVFVVILVGIALYNVLGFTEKEQYKLQTVLPKFAIALIAVNFSFLACKLVLDATNVATQAVFAIPYSNEEARSTFKTNITQAICRENAKKLSKFCSGPGNLSELGEKFFGTPSSDNLAVALAVYLGKLSDQDFVKTVVGYEEGKSVSKLAIANFTQLTINTIFGLTMYLVFGFSFIALFIVLLARLVVLWLVIALSPLIAIKIALPDLMAGLGDELDLDKKFIQHAGAPIIIGFAFVIGYLMLDAYQGSGLGDIALLSLEEIASENTVISGISDLQSFLIAACAVAVIWLGTFAAASKTVASSVTDTLKQAGTRVGKFVMKAPLYIPAFDIRVPGEPEGARKKTGMEILRSFDSLGSVLDKEFGQPLFGERSAASLVRGQTATQAGQTVKNSLGSLTDKSKYDDLARQLYADHGKKNINLETLMKRVGINRDPSSLANFLHELRRVNPEFAKSFTFTDFRDARAIEAKIGTAPKKPGAPAKPGAAPVAPAAPAVTPAVQATGRVDTVLNSRLPASTSTDPLRRSITNLTSELQNNTEFQRRIMEVNAVPPYIAAVQALNAPDGDTTPKQNAFKGFLKTQYNITDDDNKLTTAATATTVPPGTVSPPSPAP